MRTVRFFGLAAAAMLAIGTSAAPASVITTAGTITGLEGDRTHDWTENPGTPPTFFVFEDAASPDGVGTDNILHVVLDLGSTKDVETINYVNRIRGGGNWGLNAKSLNILVSSDESGGGFDPNQLSSFTNTVYSGDFSPASMADGATQSAQLTSPTSRRYFLLDFTASYVGTINGVVADDRAVVQLSDIQVSLVPEPATGALLLMVGLGALFHRRQSNV